MGKIKQISLFRISKFWFFKSALLLSDRFWANILYVQEFFWAESLQKNLSLCHEKLQRNPSFASCLIFLFFYLMALTIWNFWQTPAGVRWGQKLNGSSTGTLTHGLDHKKSNSGKSLGTLRLYGSSWLY